MDLNPASSIVQNGGPGSPANLKMSQARVETGVALKNLDPQQNSSMNPTLLFLAISRFVFLFLSQPVGGFWPGCVSCGVVRSHA